MNTQADLETITKALQGTLPNELRTAMMAKYRDLQDNLLNNCEIRKS